MTFLCLLLIYVISSQEIKISVSDLTDNSWSITGWTAVDGGSTNNYNPPTDITCQQNLLPITIQNTIYKKQFIITDQEFYQLFIEMDIYFIKFRDCAITIYVNSQQIYQQSFTNSKIALSKICGSSTDSQYTLFQGFYTTSQILNLQISYTQTIQDQNSYIGFRNLNIYSNGIPLINNCPFDKPFVQTDGSCVAVCNNGCQYLSGPQFRFCTTDTTSPCTSKYLATYPTTTPLQWRFYTTSPNAQEQQLLAFSTPNYYIINSNDFPNMVTSAIFNSSFNTTSTKYFYLSQSMTSSAIIQVTIVFYIIGEWTDGSNVFLYMQGTGIYVQNAVNIQRSGGVYTNSCQNDIYFSNMTFTNGTTIRVRKTLIVYSGNFYAGTVKIGFQQRLDSTGSYGFGDVIVYTAASIPNVLLYGLYGQPYKCSSPYYAYMGSCVLKCPKFSVISEVNRNCTDYVQTESSIFNSTLTMSAQSKYYINSFYDNNFQQSDLDSLFTIKPLFFNNFLNGLGYSFVGNKKIIGGYNSWGSGTYGLYLSGLNSHYKIRIYFTLYMIDNWQAGDQFSYYIDGDLIQSFSQTKQQQIQGQSSLDQYLSVSKDIYHTQKTVAILFVCNLQAQDSREASCGMSDLFFLVDKNQDVACQSVGSYFSFVTLQCEQCVTSSTACTLYPVANPVSNKCSVGCINCSSSTVCAQCDAQSGYLISGTQCGCFDGYVLITQICQNCYYSCLTCQGTSVNKCLTCDASRTLSSGRCLCATGYVDVFSIQTCQLIQTINCHYSCLTCYGQQYYNCASCPQNSFRTLVQNGPINVCSCNTNYTESGVTNCSYTLPCDINCLTCNGGNSNNCLTCKTNYVFQTNQCICPTGYNILNAQQNCNLNYSPCHPTCLTCIDQNINSCITCDSNDNRLLITVDNLLFQYKCQCLSTFYDLNNICNPCDSTCLTCNNGGNTNCLTCDSSKSRQLNGSNQCQCYSGYNDFINPGSTCYINLTVCHYSCNTCYGTLSNQCIDCPASSNRALSSHTCSCNSGYSDNNSQTICFQCDSTCLTCSGTQSNQCLSCDSNSNRSLTNSSCLCSSGYNNIVNQSTCVQNYSPCYYTCDVCSGPSSTECLTCGGNRTLQTDKSCPCDSGFNDYLNQSNSCVVTLTSCHYSCNTCYGLQFDQCIDCPPSSNRTFNQNKCNCNTHHGDNNNQQICFQCDSTCLTCFGTNQNECLSCDSSLFRVLNNSQCICQSGYNNLINASNCTQNFSPCYYTCDVCSGTQSNNCLTCGSNRTLQSDNTCPCNLGYNDRLLIGNSCQANLTVCNYTCNTCYGTQINQCLDCPALSNRTLNGSTCSCDSGYGDNNIQQICFQCYSTCLTCSGTTYNDCLSCDSNQFRIISASTCICQSGYNNFQNQLTCVLNYSTCHYTCDTCYGPNSNNCLSCGNSSNRTFQSDNSCPCDAGYNDLLNQAQFCAQNMNTCHYSCNYCFGSLYNQCIDCPANANRQQVSNTCPCNSGLQDNNGQICFSCHQTCLTCSGSSSNQCLTCDSQLNLSINNNICECSSGYNNFVDQNQCVQNYQPCDISCYNCYGPFTTNCLSCGNNNHRTLQNDQSCPCDSGYNNLLNQGIQCEQDLTDCNYTCQTCFGIQLNQCILCPSNSNRIFNNHSCQCQQGYQDNNISVVCFQCHSSCLTCQGPLITDCLTCDITQNRVINNSQCVCTQGYNNYLNQQNCVQNYQPCYFACNTCYGSQQNNCIDCPISRVLTNDNQCDCNIGYIDPFQSQQCFLDFSPCDSSCQSCFGPSKNQCLTCPQNSYRSFNQFQCVCQLHFKEDQNSQCVPNCQNPDCLTCDNLNLCLTCIDQSKIIQDGQCKCDDGFYSDKDSNCQQCSDSCQTCTGPNIYNCLTCKVNRTILNAKCVCKDGFQEDSSGVCTDCTSPQGAEIKACNYVNPTDGIWTYGEQCDDGNDDPRDGCSNNKISPNFNCTNVIKQQSDCYKCPDNCASCNKENDQIQCLKCSDGYFNTKIQCIQCNEKFCQQCSQITYCEVCNNNLIPQNGICQNCNKTEGLYLMDQKCKSQCGDGILAFDEQCDDGDLVSLDGCSSKCQIENGFFCYTSLFKQTLCQVNEQPYLILNQIQDSENDLVQLQIQSSQQLKQYNVTFQFISDSADDIHLRYQIYNLQDDYYYLSINVNLTFTQSYDSLNVKFVIFGSLLNMYNQTLKSNQIETTLNNIVVLDTQQSANTKALTSLGDGAILTLTCLSSSSIFFGGLTQIIALINLIQQLQYIQYININFPPNFKQFLGIFNGFSLAPYFNALQLNQLQQYLNNDELLYIKPWQAKFAKAGLNANFLNNVVYFIFIVAFTYILASFTQVGLNILQDVKLYVVQNFKFLRKRIHKFFTELQKLIFKTDFLFKKTGIYSIILPFVYDIQFAILLQITNQGFCSYIQIMNSVISYLFLIKYAQMIIYPIKDEQFNNQIIWQPIFGSIKMFEAFIFQFSIVLLQDFPQCQVVIISITSLTVLLFVIAFDPFKDKLVSYNLMVQEFALFISNMSFSAYIYFPQKINQVVLGWFHVFVFLAMIGINLIITSYSTFLQIRKLFLKK